MSKREELSEFWLEVAAENGINRTQFRERVRKHGWSQQRAAETPLLGNEEYAVYRGDELLCIGTARECAEQVGVKPQTIHYYTTPTGKKWSNREGWRGLAVERIL